MNREDKANKSGHETGAARDPAPDPAADPEAPERARQRISGQVVETPVMSSRSLDALLGARLFFKCEHLQRTGSFKARGAAHAVSLLDADCRGVATHSSGNHGAALAYAARTRGLEAHVVMPDNAVSSKVEAVRAYGGQIHFCSPDQSGREAGLERLVAAGHEPVPPYDDERIIAGQGTCALEFLDQVPELDFILAPVGGGGLISGTALAVLDRNTGTRVIGVEPAGADDTIRSLAAGRRVTDHRPETMADGLRALVGARNLAIIARYVDEVIGVDEAMIGRAMILIWERLKQVVEPSGAVALAGVLTRPEGFRGARVGVVLSGGNLDVGQLLKRFG